MARITLDRGQFPLVFVRWPALVELDDIRAFGDECVAHLARRGPVVSISDIRPLRLLRVTPTLRAAFAAEVDRILRDGVELIAEATVLDSSLARGVMTAYGWIRKTPRPLAAFDDLESAEAWAQAQIAQYRAA